jgi:transketolase
MRNAFIDELVIHAEKNPNIALIVGDLGFSVIEPFADRFPDRFINAGVAEQNMAGLAAGMASEGYHAFIYSIANFPTFRCAEQIRNDIDYHKLSVTIVAVGGGLAYGNLGYSHHAIQDYAFMRSLPNMLIASPGDPMEVRACMRYIIENPQPSYLRLGKAGEEIFHQSVPNISPGKWLLVRHGDAYAETFLTTGATLQLAHDLISSNSILSNRAIHSLPMWGMSSKHLQAKQVASISSVLTLEDHLIDGGFGSWMLESLILNPNLISKIKIKSLDPIVCGMVGKQETLNCAGGLTSHIESEQNSVIKSKVNQFK